MLPTRRSSAPLLEKIVRISLSASAVDIASHEKASPEELQIELVPVVQELLLDTLAFFESVLNTYGGEEEAAGLGEPEPGNFRREVDEILEDEEDEARV